MLSPHMTVQRIVACLDLDYFYAQCEEVRRPEIRTRPVVVCVYSGRTENSGVVSTANYVARRFGVRSGIPIARAEKLLAKTDSIFLPMDMDYYENVSSEVMQIAKSHSDSFEKVSIDEAFLDISLKTGLDYDQAEKLCLELKNQIKEKTSLACSVGIAPNKLLAKMASDKSKPDGLFKIEPSSVESFLRDLPVEKLIGIGPQIKNGMEALGISTIGELARFDSERLSETFGKNAGPNFKLLANGIDEDPVKERVPEQYSRIVTLKEDANSFTFARDLEKISNDVCSQLKAVGKRCKTVGIIYITTEIRTKNRSKTIENSTDSPKEIFDLASKMYEEVFSSENKDARKIRRIGLRVSNLTNSSKEPDSSGTMTSYFSDESS